MKDELKDMAHGAASVAKGVVADIKNHFSPPCPMSKETQHTDGQKQPHLSPAADEAAETPAQLETTSLEQEPVEIPAEEQASPGNPAALEGIVASELITLAESGGHARRRLSPLYQWPSFQSHGRAIFDDAAAVPEATMAALPSDDAAFDVNLRSSDSAVAYTSDMAGAITAVMGSGATGRSWREELEDASASHRIQLDPPDSDFEATYGQTVSEVSETESAPAPSEAYRYAEDDDWTERSSRDADAEIDVDSTVSESDTAGIYSDVRISSSGSGPSSSERRIVSSSRFSMAGAVRADVVPMPRAVPPAATYEAAPAKASAAAAALESSEEEAEPVLLRYIRQGIGRGASSSSTMTVSVSALVDHQATITEVAGVMWSMRAAAEEAMLRVRCMRATVARLMASMDALAGPAPGEEYGVAWGSALPSAKAATLASPVPVLSFSSSSDFAGVAGVSSSSGSALPSDGRYVDGAPSLHAPSLQGLREGFERDGEGKLCFCAPIGYILFTVFPTDAALADGSDLCPVLCREEMEGGRGFGPSGQRALPFLPRSWLFLDSPVCAGAAAAAALLMAAALVALLGGRRDDVEGDEDNDVEGAASFQTLHRPLIQPVAGTLPSESA